MQPLESYVIMELLEILLIKKTNSWRQNSAKSSSERRGGARTEGKAPTN
jgi:hypothetical protein